MAKTETANGTKKLVWWIIGSLAVLVAGMGTRLVDSNDIQHAHMAAIMADHSERIVRLETLMVNEIPRIHAQLKRLIGDK